MPFPLIPTALGLCFLLVWVFIAGMIVGDGQRAARRDQETDVHILPLRPARPATSGVSAARTSKLVHRKRAGRAAS